jgi:hypothetical protein
LQIVSGRVFAIDLESRTGTFWGDNSRCFGWIGLNQPLALGSIRVQVERPTGLADPGWSPLAPESLASDGPASLHLEIVSGKENPTVWTANRVLFMIGKSRLCKVRLHSPEISRFHASVVCTPAGPWIVDLLSRSGVFLNGKRVAAARLDPGDQLRLGSFLIRVHARHPGARSSAESAADGLHPSVEIPNALQPFQPPAGALQGSVVEAVPVEVNGSHPLMESLLLPLIGQFTTMQNQMFEQFQQNLFMLFQMFQVTQKEQLALVHEELRQVREITVQLSSLQAELLAREAKIQAGSAVPEPPGGRDLPAPDGGKLVPQAPPTIRSGGVNGRHVAAAARAPVPIAAPVSTAVPVAVPVSAPAAAPPAAAPLAAAPLAAPPIPMASNTPRRSADERGISFDDVHARLCEKISLLQQERQSRWQKIMTFLSRK